MPVIVTLAYLYWAYGVIEWANGLLALVGIVIFRDQPIFEGMLFHLRFNYVQNSFCYFINV